jgi:hypothetical protein
MKYPVIILSTVALSCLLMLKMGVFAPRQHDNGDTVAKIAREMRDVALSCRTLSCEEVKAKRSEFLNNNKDATIADLVKAIEMKLGGQDIISLLKSLRIDACNEYAESLESAHSRGLQAINRGFGDTSIETLMYWRLL